MELNTIRVGTSQVTTMSMDTIPTALLFTVLIFHNQQYDEIHDFIFSKIVFGSSYKN